MRWLHAPDGGETIPFLQLAIEGRRIMAKSWQQFVEEREGVEGVEWQSEESGEWYDLIEDDLPGLGDQRGVYVIFHETNGDEVTIYVGEGDLATSNMMMSASVVVAAFFAARQK